MIPHLLNNNSALLDLTEMDLENAAYAGDPAVIDLLELAELGFEGLVVSARTSNVVGTPTSIAVDFAFSHSPDATPPELYTRASQITCALGGQTGSGDTRQFASARVPISGRYLHVWWETGGGTSGDTVDLEVWVHAVK